MALIFRDKFVSNSEYKKISNYVLPLIIKTAEYYSVPIEEVDHYKIYSYCVIVLDYEILFHDFGPIASKFISGRTRKIDDKISIIVNNNETHNQGRINFTTMHEIVHAFVHILNSVHPVFASASTKVDPDDIQAEIEADICASILMINDHALESKLSESLCFSELCNHFDCSYANMHMRLRSFLCYNYGMNEKYALDLINDYRYRNNKSLVQFIKYSNDFLSTYETGYYEFGVPSTVEICLDNLKEFLDFENIFMRHSTQMLISNYVFYNLQNK